jgi:hypothetical protein
MGLHGTNTNEKNLCDLPVRFSSGNQIQDLSLTDRERFGYRNFVFGKLFSQAGRDVDPSLTDLVDC